MKYVLTWWERPSGSYADYEAVRNQDKSLTNEKPVNTPNTSAMVRLVRSRETLERKLVRVHAHHPASE